MGKVEERVGETLKGVEATVESAMEGFKRVQETVDEAKATVEEMLESGQSTVHEMVERVKPVADLLVYVQQNPWLLLGGAILMGYVLGGLASEKASSR
jgi:ElaB/YqjD/DUF883 family membrane-anchored ribosome-binding protein